MTIETELISPEIIKQSHVIISPAGFVDLTDKKQKRAAQTVATPRKIDLDQLKAKKAWDVAMGPAKGIPLNLFMSYMSGNSLQMIPIMMTLMLFTNPLKAIMTTNSNFVGLTTKKNESEILMCKLVFILCQVGVMGIGVWKLNNMGLIPNSRSDWLGWESGVKVKEAGILI